MCHNKTDSRKQWINGIGNEKESDFYFPPTEFHHRTVQINIHMNDTWCSSGAVLLLQLQHNLFRCCEVRYPKKWSELKLSIQILQWQKPASHGTGLRNVLSFPSKTQTYDRVRNLPLFTCPEDKPPCTITATGPLTKREMPTYWIADEGRPEPPPRPPPLP